MSEIYQPAEDSFLLAKFVKMEIEKAKFGKVLDMGSGSGIQSETAINEGIYPSEITLADINLDVIKFLKEKFPESKVILSDLFDKIDGKFDLIIFNPPYLSNNRFDNGSDTAGGSKIINKFLKQARNHVSKKGEILLLTSSFGGKIDFSGYDREILGKDRIFFEELFVWKLSPKD